LKKNLQAGTCALSNNGVMTVKDSVVESERRSGGEVNSRDTQTEDCLPATDGVGRRGGEKTTIKRWKLVSTTR